MRKFLFIGFILFFGYSYTQTGTITDVRDGKVYKTVVIGNQTWMAENLNTDRFQNGDFILEVKTDEEWIYAGKNRIPAWKNYDNDPKKGSKYGKLYNFYAVSDPRGLSPTGWHIPNTVEWKSMKPSCSGCLVQSANTNDHDCRNFIKKIKMTEIQDYYLIDEGGYYETKWVPCNNCSYWTEQQKANNPCTVCRNKRGKNEKTGKYIPKTKKKIFFNSGWDGTNELGFSALPAGYCEYNHSQRCSDIGYESYWWASFNLDNENDKECNQKGYGQRIGMWSNGFNSEWKYPGDFYSVRCLKN